MAPLRARIASSSVVLPLWHGPTSATPRGPVAGVPFCPFAPPKCLRCGRSAAVCTIVSGARGYWQELLAKSYWQELLARTIGSSFRSTTRRPQTQVSNPDREVETDLAGDGNRLQCNGAVRAANEDVRGKAR